MVVSERYDEDVKPMARAAMGAGGRHVITVIGIDHYQHWPRLSNAVRDASGAATLFRRLGFEEIVAPLLDDRATGKAIQSLVTDDLMALGPDDSLVLFYAGHGGTRKHRLGDELIKTGYLIPVDASGTSGKVSTWVDLEGWLRAVSLLPANHILVVLDACQSGIALDPAIKWRDIGSGHDVPLPALQARRSRKIITSALDDQVAADGGPVPGHSLFTGCLIEGLTHGIDRSDASVVTGTELGVYLQRRVQSYPHLRQTPDFGTFAHDERGELVIPLVAEPAVDHREDAATHDGLLAWLDRIDLDDTTPSSAARPGGPKPDLDVGADREVVIAARSVVGWPVTAQPVMTIPAADPLDLVPGVERSPAEAPLESNTAAQATAGNSSRTEAQAPAKHNLSARADEDPREVRRWELEEQARVEVARAKAELAARREQEERERQRMRARPPAKRR